MKTAQLVIPAKVQKGDEIFYCGEWHVVNSVNVFRAFVHVRLRDLFGEVRFDKDIYIVRRLELGGHKASRLIAELRTIASRLSKFGKWLARAFLARL